MKDVKVTIGATTIKSLHYDHSFNAKAGEAIQMSVSTKVSVNLNPSAPTVAMVAVKHTVADQENKIMKMEIETITPVSVSTFVDNLDDVIKKNFLNHIMLAVSEKIRSTCAFVGLNVQTPAVAFTFRDGQDSIDTEIYTKV